MKVLLLILLVVIFNEAHSQQIEARSFIFPLISKYSDSEKLVYTDRITEWGYERAKETINNRIYGKDSNNKKITFRFTKNEQEYILRRLELCTKPFWQDSLFENSKMIELDSFSHYFKTKINAKRKILPLIDTPGYSRQFRLAIISELKRRNWVYIFSDPIYIRNATLAVLYLEARCGWDCGYDELVLYRNINGIWKKWIYVFQGNY